MKHARVAAFVLFSATCALSTAGHAATAAGDASGKPDTAAVYKSFLHQWMGKNHEPVNLALSAEPLKPDADTGCAERADIRDALNRPPKRIDDLSQVLGNDPSVRYVNKAKWKPDDPAAQMAKGKSVDDAVKAGFAAALLTFSAVSFNEAHDTAVFSFSFVCGSLCGNGGVVVMRKQHGEWVRDTQECSMWISEVTLPTLRKRGLA